MYIYISLSIYIFIYILCMYVCMYECMYVCIYIYIYIYYTYTHTHTRPEAVRHATAPLNAAKPANLGLARLVFFFCASAKRRILHARAPFETRKIVLILVWTRLQAIWLLVLGLARLV